MDNEMKPDIIGKNDKGKWYIKKFPVNCDVVNELIQSWQDTSGDQLWVVEWENSDKNDSKGQTVVAHMSTRGSGGATWSTSVDMRKQSMRDLCLKLNSK
jgi:hypothetical protein